MSAATLKITDGTTNIDFTGSNFKVLTAGGWAPRRAGRRQSQLAGMSPYEDVLETMYIRIVGSSVANCLALLEDLSELLDQAERWGKGENVTAVEIQYKPTGSALASAVTANIVGPPEGGDFLTLPSDFDAVDDRNYALGTHANPIILQFVRRGLWLGTTEAESSSAGVTPDVLDTTTFTNNRAIHCPTDIRWYINRASGTVKYDAWMVLTNEGNKVHKNEGEAFTTSATGTGSPTFTGGTSNSIAAASDTYVARMTFQNIDNVGTATESATGILDSNSGTWAWWICADNNTGFDVTVQMGTYSDGGATYGQLSTAKKLIIPATDTVPKIYYLGITSSQPPLYSFQFTVEISQDATGLPKSIDFDYVIGLALDDNAHILKAINVFGDNTDTYLHADHRLDGYITPIVYETSNGSNITNYPAHDGRAAIYLTGNACSGVLFGTDAAGTYMIDSGSSTAAAVTLQATRTEGYLTPE